MSRVLPLLLAAAVALSPAVARADGGNPTGPPADTGGASRAVALALYLLAPVAFILVLAAMRRRSRPAGWVRVTAPPPGEAPPGIRAAWVGLDLPLAPGFPDPVTLRTVGVMTGASVGAETGYVVDGRAAVATLREWNPAAAAWWEEHVPQVLARGHRLLFAAEVCDRIG